MTLPAVPISNSRTNENPHFTPINRQKKKGAQCAPCGEPSLYGHSPFSIFNSPLFPFPLADFRHILTVLGDILLMLHQLIAHLLVEVRAAVAKLRQAQQNVLDEVEAVDIILHAHIERRVMVPSSL